MSKITELDNERKSLLKIAKRFGFVDIVDVEGLLSEVRGHLGVSDPLGKVINKSFFLDNPENKSYFVSLAKRYDVEKWQELAKFCILADNKLRLIQELREEAEKERVANKDDEDDFGFYEEEETFEDDGFYGEDDEDEEVEYEDEDEGEEVEYEDEDDEEDKKISKKKSKKKGRKSKEPLDPKKKKRIILVSVGILAIGVLGYVGMVVSDIYGEVVAETKAQAISQKIKPSHIPGASQPQGGGGAVRPAPGAQGKYPPPPPPTDASLVSAAAKPSLPAPSATQRQVANEVLEHPPIPQQQPIAQPQLQQQQGAQQEAEQKRLQQQRAQQLRAQQEAEQKRLQQLRAQQEAEQKRPTTQYPPIPTEEQNGGVCETVPDYYSSSKEYIYYVKRGNKYIPAYKDKNWDGKGIKIGKRVVGMRIDEVNNLVEVEKGKYLPLELFSACNAL